MASSPSPLRRWGALGIAAIVAASGCNAILGLTDVSLDPTGTGGAGGTTTTTTTGAGGAGGSTTTTTGTGGTGGSMTGDFELAVGVLGANVPLDGHAFLDVEIVKSGGFDDAVEVGVQASVAGLDVTKIQIPAGETKGVLVVGVTAPFTLGQTFPLKLRATSGKLVHDTEVPATVTGKPGSLDISFGTEGVSAWPFDAQMGSLASIETASNGILVAGHEESGLGIISMFGARLAKEGGLDETFNAGGKVKGVVNPVFCGCGGLFPEQGRKALRFANDEVVIVGSAPRLDKSQYDITIARFHDDGTPKDDNGDKGLKRIDTGDGFSEHVVSVAKAAGPKLVALGTMNDVPGLMFLARISGENNGVDSSFANNGRVFWQGRTPVSVVVDAMDRVVVISTENTNWHIDRLLSSGMNDAQAVHPFDTDGIPIAVAVRPDGGLVVLTAIVDLVGTSFSVWFLDANLDPSDLGPNPNPAHYDPTPAGPDEPAAIAALPDGRFMILGRRSGANVSFLGRLLADGTPDPTFGDGIGFLDLSLGPSTSLQVMTVLADGKVLVGGTISGVPAQFVVGRVWN